MLLDILILCFVTIVASLCSFEQAGYRLDGISGKGALTVFGRAFINVDHASHGMQGGAGCRDVRGMARTGMAANDVFQRLKRLFVFW